MPSRPARYVLPPVAERVATGVERTTLTEEKPAGTLAGWRPNLPLGSGGGRVMPLCDRPTRFPSDQGGYPFFSCVLAAPYLTGSMRERGFHHTNRQSCHASFEGKDLRRPAPGRRAGSSNRSDPKASHPCLSFSVSGHGCLTHRSHAGSGTANSQETLTRARQMPCSCGLHRGRRPRTLDHLPEANPTCHSRI